VLLWQGGARFSELGGLGGVVVDLPPLPHPLSLFIQKPRICAHLMGHPVGCWGGVGSGPLDPLPPPPLQVLMSDLNVMTDNRSFIGCAPALQLLSVLSVTAAKLMHWALIKTVFVAADIESSVHNFYQRTLWVTQQSAAAFHLLEPLYGLEPTTYTTASHAFPPTWSCCRNSCDCSWLHDQIDSKQQYKFHSVHCGLAGQSHRRAYTVLLLETCLTLRTSLVPSALSVN